MRSADSSSSARTQRSLIPTRSPPSSSRSGDRNGWSIRRSHSADPKPFSRTSRATHIASPSPITGLIAADAVGVTFKYKDYRIQGPERYKLMTLATDEFIRRFLMHVLPKGFHRIRHYGLLANGSRADNVAKARALLNVPKPDAIPADPKSPDPAEPSALSRPCPCCGGRLLIIETFARGCEPNYRPATATSRDQDRYVMMEIALSTATQRRPFLPFLPLTVSQRRRRSLDDAAPTSCDRRRHAKPDPNADGARSPRPVNPSNCRASVVPASRKQTLALLKSP